MAKQLVPNVAQFRMVQAFTEPTLGTVIDVINDFYVRNTAVGWNVGGLTATATAIRDAWVTNVLPLLSDQLTLVRVDAEDLGADPGFSASVNSGAAGTILTDVLPASVTAVVQFRCDPGAFPRDGAMHLSGIPEAVTSGADVDDTFRTNMQTAIGAVHTAAGAAVLGNAIVRISRSKGTAAQLEAVREARQALRDAIRATRLATGVSNTLQFTGVRNIVGSQRDRRS